MNFVRFYVLFTLLVPLVAAGGYKTFFLTILVSCVRHRFMEIIFCGNRVIKFRLFVFLLIHPSSLCL